MYKTGDKVRVIAHRYSADGILYNSIGTVREILNNGAITVSKPNETYGWFMYTKEVEPYKEEVMNDKIEVGDTVEQWPVSNTSHKFKNTIVTKIENERVYVTKTDGQEGWVNINYTRLVSKGNKMKEIIGYNIKKEFEHKEASIAKALNSSTGEDVNGTWMHNGDTAHVPNKGMVWKAKELGVLDLWFEPVYKSSEVKVQLSNNRYALIKNKTHGEIFLTHNTKASVDAREVKNALDALNSLGQVATYNLTVEEFQLGCQTFMHEDLFKVDKAFKDFQ